jgi:hypothetical protein
MLLRLLPAGKVFHWGWQRSTWQMNYSLLYDVRFGIEYAFDELGFPKLG